MRIFLIIALLQFSFSAFSQIAGKWTSIDDNSGQPRSIIEITERTGKFFGKVVKIHSKPNEDPDPACDKCDEADTRFKKKVIGMEILQGLSKVGDELRADIFLIRKMAKSIAANSGLTKEF